MLVLNLTPDQASAAIEALLSLIILVITVSLSGIVTTAKANKLHNTGEVDITPNDFTSGMGHLDVLLFERYVSVRGLVVFLIAVTLTVLSSTVLLGTEASRCSLTEGRYASLSEERETTCYTERATAVPTSGIAPATIMDRLLELVYEEPDVPVHTHPSSFDFTFDKITDFSSVVPEDDVWGRVMNLTSCDFKIVKDDEQFTVGTSSEELSNLTGIDDFQPSPGTVVWIGRFGFLQEQLEEQTAYLYAKEVRSAGISKVHLLFAHGEHGRGRVVLEDTNCASLEFDGLGFRVLPLRSAAIQLVKRGVDPLRLLEVAWLGATIAEQTPRQIKCRRRNYGINTCTRLSNNTVFTIATLGLLAGSTLIVLIFMSILNRRCKVTRMFTRYQLFATAARYREGRIEGIGGLSNRTRARLASEGNFYYLQWGKDEQHAGESNAEIFGP